MKIKSQINRTTITIGWMWEIHIMGNEFLNHETLDSPVIYKTRKEARQAVKDIKVKMKDSLTPKPKITKLEKVSGLKMICSHAKSCKHSTCSGIKIHNKSKVCKGFYCYVINRQVKCVKVIDKVTNV